MSVATMAPTKACQHCDRPTENAIKPDPEGRGWVRACDTCATWRPDGPALELRPYIAPYRPYDQVLEHRSDIPRNQLSVTSFTNPNEGTAIRPSDKELVSRYTHEGPCRCEDCLKSYVRFSYWVMRRTSSGCPPYTDWDDLRGAALEGLTVAMDRFSPKAGASWNTYLARGVRNQVLNAIRSQYPATRGGAWRFHPMHMSAGLLTHREDQGLDVGRLDLLDRVFWGVTTLPPLLRDTVRNVFYAEVPPGKLALKEEVSNSAISHRIERAIALLREYLEEGR